MACRRQAIIWTNAGMLLIGTLGTNFSEFFNEIYVFLFKKMHLKMLSAKWPPFVSASMCKHGDEEAPDKLHQWPLVVQVKEIVHIVPGILFVDIIITLTSHEHHGISDHRQLGRLLNSFQANN